MDRSILLPYIEQYSTSRWRGPKKKEKEVIPELLAKKKEYPPQCPSDFDREHDLQIIIDRYVTGRWNSTRCKANATKRGYHLTFPITNNNEDFIRVKDKIKGGPERKIYI